MKNNPTIVQAKDYVNRGFSVIPLLPKDKRPLISWEEFQHRRPTEEELLKWFGNSSYNNIGIVTGKISGIVAVDFDSQEAVLFWRRHHFTPTPLSKTGKKGYHAIYRYKDGVRNFQKRDDLPGIDLRGDGGYIVAPPSIHPETGKTYEWVNGKGLDDLSLAELPEIILAQNPGQKVPLKEVYKGTEEGSRNDGLARLAGSWVSDGLSLNECLEMAVTWNSNNQPPLPKKEIERTVRSIFEKHHREKSATYSSLDETQECYSFPNPNSAMFYGLAGEIVKAVEPHTEADPVALLTQVLTSFGNVAGRNCYYEVEADRHFTNLFTVLVGETSKARKGTSWGHVRKIFHQAQSEWIENNVQSGLASGEGLIWAVRDALVKNDATVDEGINDKRLLVLEAEFASVLKISSREGNILSAVIRQAWDNGNLKNMTKNNPAKATDAHISIIGHITKDELRRYLTATEAGNGFANRFLWLCVKRSKCLPRGGNFQSVNLNPLIKELREAIDFARQEYQIEPNKETWQIWDTVYPLLSEGGVGLLGAVTSRAEAQVVRIAMLHALMDKTATIRPNHLLAALALWDYAYQSARYVFGSSLGDPIADEILQALKMHPEGMNRTDIHNIFGRNRKGEQISKALNLLLVQNKAEKHERDTDGRKLEIWITKKTN